jgi:hypothetical protein
MERFKAARGTMRMRDYALEGRVALNYEDLRLLDVKRMGLTDTNIVFVGDSDENERLHSTYFFPHTRTMLSELAYWTYMNQIVRRGRNRSAKVHQSIPGVGHYLEAGFNLLSKDQDLCLSDVNILPYDTWKRLRCKRGMASQFIYMPKSELHRLAQKGCEDELQAWKEQMKKDCCLIMMGTYTYYHLTRLGGPPISSCTPDDVHAKLKAYPGHQRQLATLHYLGNHTLVWDLHSNTMCRMEGNTPLNGTFTGIPGVTVPEALKDAEVDEAPKPIEEAAPAAPATSFSAPDASDELRMSTAPATSSMTKMEDMDMGDTS